MLFKYIKLVNFIRFPLREASTFEYNFNSKLTMITGPNGAGKSSLFNELTPLPADKTNFSKNGYKEIHIEKDNKLYVLISDFRGPANYNFLVDGNELNTSGLVTAQRDLVEKHFNITQSVHDLMVGIESFTSLSLLARKKLFSSITHLNIDKILEGYNHLKEELKTNKLLLKSQATAYQVEEDKLINKDRLEDLKRYLEDVKYRTDTLLDIRTEIGRYTDNRTSEDNLIELSRLVALSKETLSNNYTLITSYPYKDIPRYLETITKKLSVTDYRLLEVYKQLELKEKTIKQMEVVGLGDTSELLKRKLDLETHIAKLTNSLRIFKDLDSFNEDTALAVYLLETNLPDILQNLQTNVGLDGERLFTVEKYNSLVDKKKDQIERLQSLMVMEISLKRNLERVESMEGDISCPACNHTWPIKEAISSSSHTKEELERIQTEQYKLKKLIAATEQQLEETTEYFSLYKQFNHIRKETEHKLSPFWRIVYEKNIIFTDPSGILTYLSIASLDVALIADIRSTQEELRLLISKLEQQTSIANLSIEGIKKEVKTLTESTKELQIEKYYLNKELDTINRAKNLYIKFKKIEELINLAKIKSMDFTTDHLARSICNELDDELRNLKLTALSLEKEIHEANTIQYALDKYKKDMEDTQENIKVLDLALEELCPKNGLIAKSVSSFLNTIIYNINNTIDKIWDYKMIIKPIDVDNESLNYKFKVEVEDKLTINDISTCSSGMKEILDLSFRMVLYRLLGFENYPFFLDECGVRLDSEHRARLLSLVFTMISSPFYSQIFMITHIDISVSNFRDVGLLEL